MVGRVALGLRDEHRAASFHTFLLHLLLVWLDVGARTWIFNILDKTSCPLGKSLLGAAKGAILARISRFLDDLHVEVVIFDVSTRAGCRQLLPLQTLAGSLGWILVVFKPILS